MGTHAHRDIVVIGASAGGIETLPQLLAQLPSQLDASLFIVQHRLADSSGYLVDILRKASSLPVRWAEQGDRVEPGQVYVAPADVHMTFTDHHVRLAAGPRVNHSRPSIDLLFRSAAASHGSRTIGVLLTGMLHDGIAGLDAIRRTGGYVMVQEPQDAVFPELPRNALATITPDRVVRIAELGSALVELTRMPVTLHEVPPELALEARLDVDPTHGEELLDRIGQLTTINCPDCGGSLWKVAGSIAPHLRCYVGHVVSARELLERKGNEVEAALWSAVRALRERANTFETLADDARQRGNSEQMVVEYARRAREQRAQAELAREFLLELVSKLGTPAISSAVGAG